MCDNLRTCAQRNDNIKQEDEKGAGGHLPAQAVTVMFSRLRSTFSMSAMEAACQPETMWRKARHSCVQKVAKPAKILQNQSSQHRTAAMHRCPRPSQVDNTRSVVTWHVMARLPAWYCTPSKHSHLSIQQSDQREPTEQVS